MNDNLNGSLLTGAEFCRRNSIILARAVRYSSVDDAHPDDAQLVGTQFCVIDPDASK